MNKNKNKEKILNVRICKTIDQNLKIIAKRENKTVSEIVRLFITKGLLNYKYGRSFDNDNSKN